MLEKVLEHTTANQRYEKSDLDGSFLEEIHGTPVPTQSKQFNYERPYDIITLHPLGDSPEEPPPTKLKKDHAPIRNLYNLINGEKLSDDYLKDRHIVLPKQYPKRELDRSRDFNIVNLEYKNDNTARQQQEEARLRQEIAVKCAAKHVYDNIYNRYYNPEEE